MSIGNKITLLLLLVLPWNDIARNFPSGASNLYIAGISRAFTGQAVGIYQASLDTDDLENLFVISGILETIYNVVDSKA